MIWILRTAAILLLGLGAALVLLPFPAELRGVREQAFVELSVEAPPYSREQAEAAIITINQPATRGRKERVISALLDNAPPDKQEMLEASAREW